MSSSIRRCQRRKKIQAIEYFGGKCQVCGYNRCINALEFHHIDEKSKEASPSYIIMRWSWSRIKAELSKCILLCANCHREIHYKYMDIDLQKIIKSYTVKKCGNCDDDFQTLNQEQKFCSNKCSSIFNNRGKNAKYPTRDELINLINSYKSWVKIGKMYLVSDNAVRKWARSHQINWIGRNTNLKIIE